MARARSSTATQPTGPVSSRRGEPDHDRHDPARTEPRDIRPRDAEPSSRRPSPTGKRRGRFDALVNGSRARPIVRPAESQAEFDRRLDLWIAEQAPLDDAERALVRRAVGIASELDQVRAAKEARRAALWYADAQARAAQAEEVVVLGRRLYFDPVGPLCVYPHPAPAPSAGQPTTASDRLAQLEGRSPRAAAAAAEPRRISYSGLPEDPDDPARIMVRLEARTLGCAWLLDRWGELKDLLEDGLFWQPHDRLKAVRMLGRQPLEAVNDKRVMSIYTCCGTMDPTDGHEFTDLMSELGASERATCMDRLNAREPTLPEGPEAARSALLALIAEEEERLEAIRAGHLEREEAELTAALAFDTTPEGERLRKYELALGRELLRDPRESAEAAQGGGRGGCPGRASPAASWIGDSRRAGLGPCRVRFVGASRTRSGRVICGAGSCPRSGPAGRRQEPAPTADRPDPSGQTGGRAEPMLPAAVGGRGAGRDRPDR